MRFTARRRIVGLLMLACLVGYYYISWAVEAARNLVRHYRFGFVLCTGSSWRDLGNPACGGLPVSGRFVPLLAWVELIGGSAVLVALGWLLARWALRPVAAMADTVGRLGPTSLGLRLRGEGPADETRRLAEAIDSMLDRVAEGYEAQRRFAANASHELRTPLATQRALIEISLAGGALEGDQLALLTRQLLATNERNEKLVEGLLVLAETERGLMARAPQRLDLLVAAALDLVRPGAEQAGLELHTDLQPVTVAGEQPLLERLAANLIGNAVKYNVAGGWVRVTVDASARLTVSNSGPRLDTAQVPGLFEPFRRHSGDRLDHGGGVGLGLTIVRSIVTAHQGAVQAQANPAGGLTVEVRLSPIC